MTIRDIIKKEIEDYNECEDKTKFIDVFMNNIENFYFSLSQGIISEELIMDTDKKDIDEYIDFLKEKQADEGTEEDGYFDEIVEILESFKELYSFFGNFKEGKFIPNIHIE